MRTEVIKIYQIEEHPDKDKCFEWIRDNWHDLNDHSVSEVVDSLKALQKEIGGELDYSISAVGDRGEYIRFTNYDEEALKELDSKECPLTGVCWDIDVIEGLKVYNPETVLRTLHGDTEYQYSDEGLLETCISNEYEFLESGEVY